MNLDLIAPPIRGLDELSKRFAPTYEPIEVTSKATRLDWIFDLAITLAKLSPLIIIAILWWTL